MFKLDLEKLEEPEIKLPTSVGSSKKQDNSRKTSTSALLTIPKPLTMRITTNCGTTDWFQIGKGVCQGVCIVTLLINLYVEYILRNARLDEAQAGIKIARRNINNVRYADDTTLLQKAKGNLNESLDEVEREE